MATLAVVVGLRRLRLPMILAFLLVGMVVGPHALGWVEATETTPHRLNISQNARKWGQGGGPSNTTRNFSSATGPMPCAMRSSTSSHAAR